MKLKGKENPFTPGFGSLPPALAGRQEVTEAFATEIRHLKRKVARPAAVLLTGPRGCGKTALLVQLRQQGHASGLDICSLNVGDMPDSASDLALRIHPEASKVIRETEGGAGYAGTGIRHRRTKEDRAPPPGILVEALRQRAAASPMLLLLDEAHEVEPSIAQALFNAYQIAATETPMLLVLAGTPDTEMHLAVSRVTFIGRTKTFPVGRLHPDAAVRAIADPLAAAGIGYDPEVVGRAAEEAQRYPYFLQCMGEALWDAAAAGTEHVGEDIYEAASSVARRGMLKLYDQRTKELTDNAMLAGAAELALSYPPGKPDVSDVKSFIKGLARRWQYTETEPPRGLPASEPARAATQLLLHTGFVWEPEPGRWEFGIPAFADHVVDVATAQIGRIVKRSKARVPLLTMLEDSDSVAGGRTAVAAAVSEIMGGKHRNAVRFIDGLQRLGAIGPTGVRTPDGEPEIALLTPRIAAVTLEYADTE